LVTNIQSVTNFKVSVAMGRELPGNNSIILTTKYNLDLQVLLHMGVGGVSIYIYNHMAKSLYSGPDKTVENSLKHL